MSKAATVRRIKRALTITGRKEKDADLDASKLIYPAMQVADIHWVDLDLALGGMDQRHGHMPYRDLAPKLGWKQVVVLNNPLLSGLDGSGRMDLIAGKKSMSKPDASIFLNGVPNEVERPIRNVRVREPRVATMILCRCKSSSRSRTIRREAVPRFPLTASVVCGFGHDRVRLDPHEHTQVEEALPWTIV